MKLGIFGAGSFGKEVLDMVYSDPKRWDEILFIDDVIKEEQRSGIRVYRYCEIMQLFGDELEILIATGEPYYREKLFKQIKRDGYRIATFISDKAHIARGCVIEEGCIIFPYAFIGVDATLKKNIIVHAGAKIESNTIVKEHSVISLGAFVGADTIIERGSFIGPNASVKNHLSVGEYSVIGMGTVVINSIEKEMVVVGNPSRMIRKNISKKIFDYSVIK